MRDRIFWILFILHGLWLVGMSMAMVHLVPYATGLGVAGAAAAAMLSVIGGMSVIGRVVLAVVTERLGPRLSLIFLLGLQAATMLLLAVSRSEWLLWSFTFLFGFSYGGLASVFPLATSEFFGLKAMGSIFGMILLGATLGGTIGPVLAGYMFDLTQQYSYAFVTGCLAIALGGLMALLVRR